MKSPETTETPKEEAILIGIHIKKEKKNLVEKSLTELEFLADTAGVVTVKKILVPRDYIDSKFVVGTGKIEEIIEYATLNKIKLVIFDEQLTPVQERNLRRVFNFKVLDRVELILDIFSKNAKTHEAKIQIELAQLKYLLPRLTRMWEHLSRQVGGVGVRGPGETQIEIDRRRIREKIHQLNKKLQEVRKSRQIQRKQRNKQSEKRFALVGYTNAGKSSLLNALTQAEAYVENMLFCTLDPLSRKFVMKDGSSVLLTDTVGFINKLPHFLVEAFKATLEEVYEADYLIHVIDGSDNDIGIKIAAVKNILFEEMKITDKHIFNIINKADQMNAAQKEKVLEIIESPIFISAKKEQGIDDLQDVIIDFLEKQSKKCNYFFPMNMLGDSKILYNKARIIKEEYKENGLYIKAYITDEIEGILSRFEHQD